MSNGAPGRVAAILLAAGRASRFGAASDDSKVLADYRGQALVRRVAMMALASAAAPVVVVTGQAVDAVSAALADLPVRLVHNPDYASGIAGSLNAGLAAIPPDARGALILLADMPLVATETLNRLIARFDAEPGAADAIIPTFEGRHGNPALVGRSMFEAIARLRGDQGARKLLSAPGCGLALCPVDDRGIEVDVDTRDALAALTRGDGQG